MARLIYEIYALDSFTTSSVEIQYFAPMHKLSFCMLDDIFPIYLVGI